ncbi:MAG: site-specific integrase [Planctomycetes bacterium]|nr:site-specific integrase [Planctomycetota bacterium]
MTRAAQSHWTGNPYRRPGSPCWSFVFKDVDGVVRRRSAKTTDLRIARRILDEKLREIEQAKLGHGDRFAATRTLPIRQFVDEYRATLEANQSAPRYVSGTVRQLKQFLSFAKVRTLPDLHIADAERFVTSIRSKRSAKTRDHYASSLRGFTRWLERTGRWDCDPLKRLSVRTPNRDRLRVFKRVSFRFEEAERLVEAAWNRYEAERSFPGTPSRPDYGEEVRDRQVLYWVALTTALRANECASLAWENLGLDDERPSVRLDGKFTKNGDDAVVPLQAFVAEALREMRARRDALQASRGAGPVPDSDRVFHVNSKLARLVRKDAEFAGLASEHGITAKRIDFHCLRKSCARILIELKVHPKVIQQVLRHSDIRLTMDLYGELGEDDLFRELPGTFPVPRMYAPRKLAPVQDRAS